MLNNLVKIHKALSDSNRLRILKMLKIKPLCVCEIREILNLANSTVSKHLSILKEAGFIEEKKDGKWVIYSLSKINKDLRIRYLLKNIDDWIPENEILIKDRKMVQKVNKIIICSKN